MPSPIEQLPHHAPDPFAMDADTIQSQVMSLQARFSAGRVLDPEARATCAATLETLRGVWRRTPELFRHDVMVTLKDISRALRSVEATTQLPLTQVAPRQAFAPDAARMALKDIFGF
ncbi:MAG: hypothetical protein H7X95_12885, partial [Deltaproteobacteria bacterium]|nr:hypothetical protein [Deltaproteobacteria bacterium]